MAPGWISRLVESPDRENREKMYHESATTLRRYRIGILLWPRTIEANLASMAKTFILKKSKFFLRIRGKTSISVHLQLWVVVESVVL